MLDFQQWEHCRLNFPALCLIKIVLFLWKALVWRVFHSHKSSALSLLGCFEVCKLIELFAQKHLFWAYDTHLHILKHIKCTYGLHGCGLECIFKNLWLAAVQIWVVRVISVVCHSNMVMTEVLVFICFKRIFRVGMDFELYLVLGHCLGDHGRTGLPAGGLRLLLPQPEHRTEPGHGPGLKNPKDHKATCEDGGCVTIRKSLTPNRPSQYPSCLLRAQWLEPRFCWPSAFAHFMNGNSFLGD